MTDLKQIIGKNIYIWDIKPLFDGNPNTIAAELKMAEFQSVILHSTRVTNWKQADRIALVKALRTVNISVFGGCAVYGDNSDGQKAGQFCLDYGLAGWVFDAELAFDKLKSPDSAAANLLRMFKQTAPSALAGWCWWAFYQSKKGATYHPKGVLWAAMADAYGDADFGVPMVYWSWQPNTAANAVKYLEESWRQWRLITDKPLVPAGRAYIGDEGTPTADAMIAFEKRARELGAVGVTWWALQYALNTTSCPFIWPTLKDMDPFSEVATPQPPIPEPTFEHWYDGLSDHEIIMKLAGAHDL